MLHEVTLDCPWCGAPTGVLVDCSGGSQTLVEDCEVCCSPMLVVSDCDPVTLDLVGLSAVRENE